MNVTLPDGSVVEGVPDGTTKAQLKEKLVSAGRWKPEFDASPKYEPAPAPEKSTLERLGNSYKEAVGAVVEPVAQMATGAIAAPVAGLAGIGASVIPGADASKVVQNVQEGLTYQPRTQSGQNVSATINAPFKWVAEHATAAGEFATDKTGSPAIGASVTTAINMLPAIIAKGAQVGVGAEASASTAAIEGAARQAATAAGLSWDKLPGQIRGQIMAVARQAKTQSLDPQSVAREAQAASHPVALPLTRGQATRDPVQLKLEEQAAQTESGKPIRDIHLEQNRKLQENLDVIKGRTGARTAGPEESGGVVQAAERAKLAQQRNQVRKLYDKAKAAGEMDKSVSVQPLVDHINSQLRYGPEGLEFAQAWLKKSGMAEGDAERGFSINDKSATGGEVSLNELEQLRQRAATVARTDKSTAGHDAGQLVGVIDSIMDKTESGPLYNAARAARKAQGAEFERQGAVGKLVGEKGGLTDRQTALEDTWKKTVLGGSIQDLRNVVRSLNSSEKGKVNATTGDVQKLGRRGIKELAGQTIDYIKQEATKSVGKMEDESAVFNANGFVKAVDKIGRPKLETLLGKTATDELYKLVDTTKNVLTKPASREAGSSTFSNILRWMDKHGGKLPFVGDVASGIARTGSKVVEMGRAGREAQRATQTPLKELSEPSFSPSANLADVVRRRGEQASLASVVGSGENR